MDIVRFKGGLGNQMFQYAFVEALRSQGREVACNLGFYRSNKGVMPFVLDSVFRSVELNEIEDEEFNKVNEKWKNIKCDPLKKAEFEERLSERFFWVESGHCLYDENVFKTQNCVYVGYWQTEKYFYKLRERLLQCFSFQVQEEKLKKLGEYIDSQNYVSVHIRRGDFQQLETHKVCTLSYYIEAMKYVKKNCNDVKFIFFSDDMDWVKENFEEKEVLLCEKGMFECYQDWYDMYLMTRCRGNIIANSSFSWWGAWLSGNDLVISPKVWLNGIETPDIWNERWIRL